MMSEIVKQRIWMMVTNAVIMLGFIILAIEFDHWWITLISALFINHERKEQDENDGGGHGKE